MAAQEYYTLPSGNRYLKSPRGILPRLIDELREERAKFKALKLKEEERVVKEFILTFYGQSASPHSRIYFPDIAGDITGIGREHVGWNRDFFQVKKKPVLYGDTDSTMTKFPDTMTIPTIKLEAEVLCEELNKTLDAFAAQYGAETHELAVKVEHVYNAFLQAGTKKRYAAIYEDPEGDIEHEGKRYKMKVRGFEVRRSNSSPFSQSLQKMVLQRILLDGTAKNAVGYIQKWIRDLQNGICEDPRQFGIPETWKGLDSNRANVTAAKWSNRYLGKNFRQWDKPVLYYGYVQGKPRTEYFALEWGEEVPEAAVLNWPRIIERCIVSPLEDILAVVGVSPKDLTSPSEDVEGFF